MILVRSPVIYLPTHTTFRPFDHPSKPNLKNLHLQHPHSNPSLCPLPSTVNQLQIQLYDTQSSLASHIDKVRTLEGFFAEHEVIKWEVGVLRQLVEAKTATATS